jgi:hypothetical protein
MPFLRFINIVALSTSCKHALLIMIEQLIGQLISNPILKPVESIEEIDSKERLL